MPTTSPVTLDEELKMFPHLIVLQNNGASSLAAMRKSFYRLHQEERVALRKKRKAAMLAGDFKHYYSATEGFATAGLLGAMGIGVGVAIGMAVSIPFAPVVAISAGLAALGFVGNSIAQFFKMKSEQKQALDTAKARRDERLDLEREQHRLEVRKALYGDPEAKDPVKQASLEELEKEIERLTDYVDTQRREAAEEGRDLTESQEEELRLKEARISKMRNEKRSREEKYENADAAWAQVESEQNKSDKQVTAEMVEQNREDLGGYVDSHKEAKSLREKKGSWLANAFAPVSAAISGASSAVKGVIKSAKGIRNVGDHVTKRVQEANQKRVERRAEKAAEKAREDRKRAAAAPTAGA